MYKTKLPNKPSEIIMMTLDDMRWVERSKKYKVDMGTFHTPTNYPVGSIGPVCRVCMAGVVMARSAANPTIELDPDDFTEDDECKLNSLDSLRCYDFESFLDELLSLENKNLDYDFEMLKILEKIYIHFEFENVEITKIDGFQSDRYLLSFHRPDELYLPSYAQCPRGFKENMETVASFFHEAGH